MQKSDDFSLNIDLYRQMYTIRRVEEALLDLFSQGLLTGTVHTSIGQEACAVGVIHALQREKDIIWSNHRCHGHYLSYSDDLEGLIAEIMGRTNGVCGGIGGSQHIHRDNFYTNGVLGGTVACATGSAFAEKVKQNHAIVTVFMGDGAMGEGIIYESMNMASLWKLPILFILEHNQYAQSTPWKLEHAGNLSNRPAAFDIPVIELEAKDVRKVYRNALLAVDRVRQNCEPLFLTLHTYRFAPHSKGDDFRAQEEIDAHRRRDPLICLREFLMDNSPSEVVRLEDEIEQRIKMAIVQAKSSPIPQIEQFNQGV